MKKLIKLNPADQIRLAAVQAQHKALNKLADSAHEQEKLQKEFIKKQLDTIAEQRGRLFELESDIIEQKPKTLTLDIAKWRCGDHNSSEDFDYSEVNLKQHSCLGYGGTRLRNSNGFYCCLGQWTEQLNQKDFPEGMDSLLEKGDVDDWATSIGETNWLCYHNLFCSKAVTINDDPQTSLQEKLDDLKELCNDYKIELVIINSKEKL